MGQGSTRPFTKLARSVEEPPAAELAARRPLLQRLALAIVRLAVAVVAIRLALGDDPRAALDTLSTAKPTMASAALLGMLVVVGLSALRWRSYLHAIGHIDVVRLTALRLTLIGGFFNAFLPTGVGGDAYKALRVAPRGKRSEAFASVMLDRFSGLVGMAVVAIVAIAVDLEATPRKLAFVAEGIAVAVVTATIVPRASREWVLKRAHIADRGKLGHSLWMAAGAVARANRSLHIAGLGYAWGITTQAALLAVHVAVARALGLEIGIGVLAAAAVIAQVAALVPLTVNGLGFREAAYVWALLSAGVAREQGAAFALAILALLLVVSAIGGLVYLVAPPKKPVASTPS